MTAAAEQTKTHAEQNAEGHAETILALYRAYKALEEGAETADAEGETYNDADAVRERAEESALDVAVRGGWHTPGTESELEGFMILLSTGGPALRITGDLGRYCEPRDAILEHQDWGTPWTEYRPDVADADDWDDALQWFVGCFYFGE